MHIGWGIGSQPAEMDKDQYLASVETTVYSVCTEHGVVCGGRQSPQAPRLLFKLCCTTLALILFL